MSCSLTGVASRHARQARHGSPSRVSLEELVIAHDEVAVLHLGDQMLVAPVLRERDTLANQATVNCRF
jgi:hypothetical protein